MAIDIYKEENYLVLSYKAEYPVGNNAEWVISKLELEKNNCVKKYEQIYTYICEEAALFSRLEV